MLILCFYCAPDVDRGQFNKCLECFCQVLESNTTSSLLIIGDFNLPGINWDLPCTALNAKSSDLLKFCSQFGLIQINRYPTTENNMLSRFGFY